jgi:hypothetical protein
LAGAGGPGGPGGPGGFGGAGGGAGGFGSFGGNSSSLTTAIKYAQSHGGGTIGVSSQSSAAAAIISSNADVAGLGGFSGRESSVSVPWLASEVASGRLRWVIASSGSRSGAPGDTRTGSQSAISVVAKACKPAGTSSALSSLYDCSGRASAIIAAGGVKG